MRITWQKPPAITNGEPTPSANWYLDSSDRQWRIGKALVNGEPVYTLARIDKRPVELICAGTLNDCKEMANERK